MVSLLSNIESNLGIKLKHSFDYSQIQVASSLLLLTGPFVLVSLVFLCLPTHLDKRIFMIGSNLGQVISLLMIGPSLLLNLPNKEWVVMSGVALLGISTASGPAFITEETVLPSSSIYPEHYDRIANLASTLRNMMFGIGQCSGALVGSFLRRSVGF